jgi:hypothetical protein
MEAQIIFNSKVNLSKKISALSITIPDCKLYYRGIVKEKHGTSTKQTHTPKA